MEDSMMMEDSLTESRGVKRPEMTEGLPLEKRACSSADVTPPTPMNSGSSVLEMHEADMDTSSSASVRSEDSGERDSPYHSDDDDEDGEDGDDRYSSLEEYQRNQAHDHSAKFHGFLSSLSNEADSSGQLAALTELCELLSMCTEESLSDSLASKLAPPLVKLAKHEYNPDIMLLAIRALTYICDVLPSSSAVLVRSDAVPALCQRLTVIEYLDVAEECLQALEKISRDQPLPCLQAGAIMAVLGFIDFFSTTVQRTALYTVVNICNQLPPGCPPAAVEAVPSLCNLLQYEDQQLVELVATCLIKMADCMEGSNLILNELYAHGLIDRVVHLIDVNSRITLSQPAYTGLVGIVSNIASGSLDAVRTLYELNIGRILKDALSNSDVLHGLMSPRLVDKTCNQVYEILRLLHELLPEVVRDKKEDFLSSKEKLLLDLPDKFEKFEMEMLPIMIQVVSSGANLNDCYGCLSVLSRLVYFSRSETLSEMFKGINIASFLAGIFTRNDEHILSLALEIAQTVLEKLPNVLTQAFIKEGVLFAIDALLLNGNGPNPTSPVINPPGRKKWCLCNSYRTLQLKSTNDPANCKVDRNSIHILAQHIKATYFSVELHYSQGMVTNVLQDLRNASAAITDLVNICLSNDEKVQEEENLTNIVRKVLVLLGGNEPISTFELVESGMIEALLNYLSNGLYLIKSDLHANVTQVFGVQKRFEAFAKISLSSPGAVSKELPLSSLVRKLQAALSSAENFPAIVGLMTKQRGSYATVPTRRNTSYPCLRVRFVRGEQELCLKDYVADSLYVDPFCLVEEIEQYLLPKVSHKNMKPGGSPEASIQANATTDIPFTTSVPGKVTEIVQSVDLCNLLTEPKGSLEEGFHLSEANTNLTATSPMCLSGDDEDMKQGQCSASFSIENGPSHLVLYLDGKPLENSSTLYQEILQRQMKSQHGLDNFAQLWSTTYTLTYKRSVVHEASCDKVQEILKNGGASDKVLNCQKQQIVPLFYSIFAQNFGSSVDPSSPTSDILFLLRCLELMNGSAFHLVSCEIMNAYGRGRIDDLDHLKVAVPTLPQFEFVSNKLTEKLEQQMRSAVHVGAMPLWCSQLMADCPFLFSFEARCKYFQLAAFARLQVPPNTSSHSDLDAPRDRRTDRLPRKKFLVCRDRILESAAEMMDHYISKKVAIEVEYSDEVGTGLGPTLEFFTLVSHEFQKAGSGMWRGGYMTPTNSCSQQASSLGLFPRPWSSTVTSINGLEFSNIITKFILLGQFVGKALQDGRVLDIPFSKAFYKLILGKELSLCDIHSFDPELGRTLQEFKSLVNRRRCMELSSMEDLGSGVSSSFRNANIKDLYLDFTLPGYSEYILASGMENVMVTIDNLEDYISLVVDATLHTGIRRQVEAFKTGLNQVISDKHLRLFNEEELERLLCGERNSWVLSDLFDHIKFDHGYTASSPPIIDLLEIISEFNNEQRRAFLQFVTGAPGLPSGGLAVLNPKLTIVRKHSNNSVDTDLPSVMTCANYLKLPAYSSKEKMKEKLMYAITEGQGCFHLS